MGDEPIRVSSAAWTGLSPEPAKAPPAPLPKPPPSPLALIASAIARVVIGIAGVWQAAVTGQVRCRGCGTLTATDDPMQYGFYVMLLMWCVPAGIAALAVGIRDARRKGLMGLPRTSAGSPGGRV